MKFFEKLAKKRKIRKLKTVLKILQEFDDELTINSQSTRYCHSIHFIQDEIEQAEKL